MEGASDTDGAAGDGIAAATGVEIAEADGGSVDEEDEEEEEEKGLLTPTRAEESEIPRRVSERADAIGVKRN